MTTPLLDVIPWFSEEIFFGTGARGEKAANLCLKILNMLTGISKKVLVMPCSQAIYAFERELKGFVMPSQ